METIDQDKAIAVSTNPDGSDLAALQNAFGDLANFVRIQRFRALDRDVNRFFSIRPPLYRSFIRTGGIAASLTCGCRWAFREIRVQQQ